MTPQQFKEIREQLGLSQPELAKILHKDKGTISRYERGLRGVSFELAFYMRNLLEETQ
jgi:transcriptional regulator with XRE-family HTH domain